MRLTARFVALALVTATACGGNDAAPPRAAPTQDITVERAVRIARAAVLRAADLPGYKASAAEGDGTEDGGSGGYGTCLRFEDHLGNHSATFKKGTVTVSSFGGAAATAATTEKELAYLAGPDFADCFERFLNGLLSGARIAVVKYASRQVPLRVRGADEATALSVRFTMEKYGARFPSRAFFAAASTGHATSFVMAFGAGKEQPPSLDRLTALLTRAVGRARAAERRPGTL
ncbi:MAG TPA: hypothetical protein VNQ77_09400 [Frankiaceae bacterium]|nr:hypothetical protein [Frankiaceae bacterium]